MTSFVSTKWTHFHCRETRLGGFSSYTRYKSPTTEVDNLEFDSIHDSSRRESDLSRVQTSLLRY